MLVIEEHACPFEAIPTWFLDILRSVQYLSANSPDEAELLRRCRSYSPATWWKAEMQVRRYLFNAVLPLVLAEKLPLLHLSEAVGTALVADELRGDGDWPLAKREYDVAEFVARKNPSAANARILTFASALITLAPGLGKPRDYGRFYHTCVEKLAMVAPDAVSSSDWLDKFDSTSLRHLTTILGIVETINSP